MDRWLLTFFIGAILSLFLAEVPAVFQLFLLFFIAISSCLHKKLRYTSGLWFGALWMLSHGYAYQHQLPNQLVHAIEQRQTMTIEGTVLTLLNQQGKTINESSSSKLSSNVSTNISIKKSGHNLSTKSNNSYLANVSSTQRFNVNVLKVNGKRLDSAINIRLSWQNPELALWQGQQLILQVKLKAAHGLSNLGGFNYVSWLKTQNIVATGYVKNTKNNQKIRSTKSSLQQINQNKPKRVNKQLGGTPSCRQYLYNKFQNILPSHVLTPILVALAFGERSLLTDSHWHILQNTGTSHLIAISGLHIGLLAAGSFYIFMLLLRIIPFQHPSWQQINMRYAAIVVSLLMASLYAYLAGFSLPTQRALVMLYLYWVARLIGINLSVKRLILMTLFILLILSPFSVMTASFWLSFYAVIIIFLTLWRFKSWLTKGAGVLQFFKGLLLIQVMLTVMLMPITAFFFQKISLVSLMANIIAVPWMSFISIPGVLLSIIMTVINDNIAHVLMTFSLYSLDALWHYLMLLSDQSHTNVITSKQTQFLILLVGVGFFIFVYCAPLSSPLVSQFMSKFFRQLIRQGRQSSTQLILIFVSWQSTPISSLHCGVMKLKTFLSKKTNFLPICLVTILLTVVNVVFMTKRDNYWPRLVERKLVTISKYFFTEHDAWQVIFFDVGQGLSILLKKNSRAILYDTGASFPSGFSMSEAVVLPYLQYAGIDYLDKVILSHSDNDHAGGLVNLLNHITIHEVMSNDSQHQQSLIHLKLTTKQQGCHSERSFSWQDLSFTVLWPLAQKKTLSEVNTSETNHLGPTQDRHKLGNDDSCVILITDKYGNSFLLSGDISSKVEKKLVLRYPNLRAEVLQVPHHGSKTSSSQRFLNQLSPTLAIVSAGYLNRWRMPVAEVSERYVAKDITLLNNADIGQIVVTFNKEGYSYQSFTEDLRPFWFNH